MCKSNDVKKALLHLYEEHPDKFLNAAQKIKSKYEAAQASYKGRKALNGKKKYRES